jgi:hypothetical protein
MQEILFIANSVIGKSALPDFSLTSKNCSEGMGVPSFHQLNRMLKCRVVRRSQKQVHVLGHENKAVQLITTLPSVSVKSYKKQASKRLDYKQSSTLPRRKGDEISARRGDQSSRLQGKRQRLEAASLAQLRSARVELVPFPIRFSHVNFHFGSLCH